MLVFTVILLVLLITSIIGNIVLYKAASRQLEKNDIYESWISEWRDEVFKMWNHMKLLDDKQMFEKDDEVGIVFQDMKMIIKSLNDKIDQETDETDEKE
jgi:hypothetical protein